ncbi:HtaA domain-containing protein [Streptomyces bohaiensis]|uniref:Htaa domain-containing protein n=1 Tax=Streptomyces bohaiensis TaxID=1431344 RepID=A0ABX1CDR5_9ACTN|nr:HtaA domain-containing protein [Streptomyces bohaiensis]NJQ17228.1 hypothetical protein [Streptomyces bohaiensis]
MTALRIRGARTSRLLLAAATATVLSATAFAAPAAADTPAPAATYDLVDGTLDWGVQESFRTYISGPIAKGSITLDDGAQRNDDGTFAFTGGTGSYDLGTHSVATEFDGSVHFEGHGGVLDLKLSDLRLVTEGRTGGAILADVTVGTDTTEDVEFARLDMSGVSPGRGDGGAMVFADIPATLTAEGSVAFGGFYEAGAALDPATLTVSAVPPAEPGDPDDGGGGDDDTEEPGTGEPGDGDDTGNPGDGDGDDTGNPGNGGDDDTDDTGNPGDGDGDDTGNGDNGGDDGGKDDDTDDGDDTGNPGDDEPASGTIADGTLDWGVRDSFRTYVTGPIARGSVELLDGATENSDGTFRFPDAVGEFDAEADALVAAFDGGVQFVGHEKADGEYELDLKFSELAVAFEGTEGVLVADVVSHTLGGDVVEYEGVVVADLTLPAAALNPVDDVIHLENVPAVLTDEGAEAFGGFYEAGADLDPLTVAVSLNDDAELPSGGGNSPAPQTGGTTPIAGGGASGGVSGGPAGGGFGAGALASTGTPAGALAGLAAAVTVAGGAASWVTRRRSASPLVD